MTLSIFCDGGARGNPGPAAYGFVIKKNGQIIKREGGTLGVATNNFAEYTALIKALGWLAENYQGQDLEVRMDSKLVVSQLSGIYKVKDARIRELVFEVRTLENQFGQIKYIHIAREQNWEADQMVNQALDSQFEI